MTYEVQNQARIQELEAQLSKACQGNALILHALNCALQLIEALIAFTPAGSPMHPGVATAQGALHEAMRAINTTLRNPTHE
jgi:hypothetical protein